MAKLFIAIVTTTSFLSLIALTGCEKVIVPRSASAHWYGITSPNFIECYSAINDAYRRMVALKKNLHAKVDYDDWSNLNSMLASALSEMELGRYDLCIEEASAVNEYIQYDLGCVKWRSKELRCVKRKKH